MTREEAIRKLQKQKEDYLDEWVDFSGVAEAYDMAISALSAEQNCDNCKEYGSYKCTKCDGEMYYKTEPTDLISRADAIEAVQKKLQDWVGYACEDYRRGLYEAQDILEALPSAEAVQGEWIMHGEPPWYVRECSKCGTKWHQWSGDKTPNYCGHCGAKMKGDNE